MLNSGNGFSVGFSDPTAGRALSNIIALVEIVNQSEPTEEKVGTFNQVLNSLLVCDSQDIKNFKFLEVFFKDLYSFKDIHPAWKVIVARSLLSICSHFISKSGLPLSDPHMKKCLHWANTTINLPVDPSNTWAALQKITACDWIAGLYQRRGVTAAGKAIPDSNQKLIKRSLDYRKKATEIALACPELRYREISDFFTKYADRCEEYLPVNSSLSDEAVKQLIAAREQELEFHSNPSETRKRIQTYVTPAHGLLELEEVTGQKDAAQIGTESNNLNITQPPQQLWDFSERSEASRASSSTREKLKSLLDGHLGEQLHAQLLTLTNKYLDDNHGGEAKKKSLQKLRDTLSVTDKQNSTYGRIVSFKEKLNELDKKMVSTHRTPKWIRYVYNACSVLTVIPALVRATKSYAQYGTCQFWKPDSQRLVKSLEKRHLTHLPRLPSLTNSAE